MYNSVIKYIYNIGQPSPLAIYRTFSSSQRGSLYPLNNNSPFLLTQLLETFILHSVSMNLLF